MLEKNKNRIRPIPKNVKQLNSGPLDWFIRMGELNKLYSYYEYNR